MKCPFSKYPDGDFKECYQTSCMAYDETTKTCKLIRQPAVPVQIPYLPGNAPYSPDDNWWRYPCVTWCHQEGGSTIQ